MAVTCLRFVRSMRRIMTWDASFFLSAASALASAFASFFAVSCSILACCSRLRVPTFACNASAKFE